MYLKILLSGTCLIISIEEEEEEEDVVIGAEVRTKDFEKPDFDAERCKYHCYIVHIALYI
jgi:hypothetical protein